MYIRPERNRLNTPEEVARRLRLPIQSVRRLIRHGRIKAVKLGHFYRVTEIEVQRIFRDGLDGIDTPAYLGKLANLNERKRAKKKANQPEP